MTGGIGYDFRCHCETEISPASDQDRRVRVAGAKWSGAECAPGGPGPGHAELPFGFAPATHPRPPGNQVAIPGLLHGRGRDVGEIDSMRQTLFTLIGATIASCLGLGDRAVSRRRSPGPASGPGSPNHGLGRLLGQIRSRRLGSLRLPAGWIGSRNITRTPEFNEAAPQFSRDGKRLLFRRLPEGEPIDGNHYGTQGELVLAAADGSSPSRSGRSGEYPWASWSPDGKQLACLTIKGIAFVDVESRQVVRTLPRKGFFQQLTWSPDGKWLSGVANSFGAGWSVARMEIATGAASAVSGADCCTPDWFPDSRSVIFSNRPRGPEREPRATAGPSSGWPTPTARTAGSSTARTAATSTAATSRPTASTWSSPGNMNEDGDPGHSGAPDGPRCGWPTRRSSGARAGSSASSIPRRRTARCSCFRRDGSRAGPYGRDLPAGGSGSSSSLRRRGRRTGSQRTAPNRRLQSKGWIAFECPD